MNDTPNILDNVLATPSKVSLLRIFVAQGTPISGREAARLAGISQRPAVRSLQDLVSLGVVNCEKLPTHHLYSINRENYLVQTGITPLFQAERGRGDAIMETLRTLLDTGTMARIRSSVEAITAQITPMPEGEGGDQINLLVVVNSETIQSQAWKALLEISGKMEDAYGTPVAAMVLSTQELQEQYASGDEGVRKAFQSSMLLMGRPLIKLLPTLEELSSRIEEPQEAEAEEMVRPGKNHLLSAIFSRGRR